MDKNDKEQIKREHKYDEIFVQYGKEAYRRNVPRKYKKVDLKKLKEEGRYETIYSKYGEKKHDKLLMKAMYRDIKMNNGTVKAILWRIKQKSLDIAKTFGIISTTAFLGTSAILSSNSENIIKENAIKYESEIDQYNQNISNYSEKIKSMNLTDTQTFMKVMDDMWKNIKGYAEPDKDIAGFFELDLATEEGYGVCRNMANDVAKKLNKINSKYNARTITVKIGEKGNYELADIDRNIYEKNETVKENTQNSEKQEESKESIGEKLLGNHMVTLVDLPQYNLTMVLDPTNPGIGLYINGQIQMLNSTDENRLEYDAKEYSRAIFFEPGIEGLENTVKDYTRSYKKPKLSFEEIEELFGVEAQNKALKEIRSMEKTNKENNFKQSIKVDSSYIQPTVQITQNNKEKVNDELEK